MSSIRCLKLKLGAFQERSRWDFRLVSVTRTSCHKDGLPIGCGHYCNPQNAPDRIDLETWRCMRKHCRRRIKKTGRVNGELWKMESYRKTESYFENGELDQIWRVKFAYRWALFTANSLMPFLWRVIFRANSPELRNWRVIFRANSPELRNWRVIFRVNSLEHMNRRVSLWTSSLESITVERCPDLGTVTVSRYLDPPKFT